MKIDQEMDQQNWMNNLKPSMSHPSPSPLLDDTMKQCIVCGDFHKSNVQGFMCNAHMCQMPNSTGEYVCEWCFCYFCCKCGNPFRDNPAAAIPGKWLQRFECLPCSKKQTRQDLYSTIIQRYQELMHNAAIVEQCRTCKINQRNGNLFSYINKSNIQKPNNAQTQLQHQQTHHQIQMNQPVLVHTSVSQGRHSRTIINVYTQQGRPLHQEAFNNEKASTQFQRHQVQPQHRLQHQPQLQLQQQPQLQLQQQPQLLIPQQVQIQQPNAGGQAGHEHGQQQWPRLVYSFAQGVMEGLGQSFAQALISENP